MATDKTTNILTITGCDPTGAAGLQADVTTIASLGGHAVTVVTSITVQTTLGILEFYDVPASIVKGQLEAVFNDIQPETVKIGLVRRTDTLGVVVDALRRYRPRHVIYAPIVLSTHGDALVPKAVMEAVHERLLPLCTLVLEPKENLRHGLSNRYASAVAFFLAEHHDVGEATKRGQAYINTQIVRSSLVQGRASELYNEFLDAVSEGYRKNSDVAYYADRLNVSSRYLAQVTRRISSKAPKTIIDEKLTESICRDLANTDLTVQEIAYAHGFSSQAHLSKFFKKQTKQTPSEYRKR
ncbi:MAG: bifunctional hydroxymethylpyrimidine kinase/phosphomethylpyrimidine kinase [Prevotella sp.]|nr:bifunctional hydroxymethylpyrimidine kinase/phosphomethylpyrimidine kinase [Prevotella sp.]